MALRATGALGLIAVGAVAAMPWVFVPAVILLAYSVGPLVKLVEGRTSHSGRGGPWDRAHGDLAAHRSRTADGERRRGLRVLPHLRRAR